MPFENISIAEYKQEESKHLKNIWKKIQLDNRPMNELKKNIRLIKKKKKVANRSKEEVFPIVKTKRCKKQEFQE